jgi:hypothetical protein
MMVIQKRVIPFSSFPLYDATFPNIQDGASSKGIEEAISNVILKKVNHLSHVSFCN